MSNLLLLADIAAKDSTKSTKDAAVQTEIFYGSGDGSERNSGGGLLQHRCCTDSNCCGCPNGGGSVCGRLFDFPSLPLSHDYVKQTEFDYLVNSTHDYYNRIEPPVGELEHSYAFFDVDTDDHNMNTTTENGILDDGCFEAMANLDEYMGIASGSMPDECLLCEEVIDEDPMIIGRSEYEQKYQADCVTNVAGVARLDELDVDELVQYLLPLSENDEEQGGASNNVPETSKATTSNGVSSSFTGGVDYSIAEAMNSATFSSANSQGVDCTTVHGRNSATTYYDQNYREMDNDPTSSGTKSSTPQMMEETVESDRQLHCRWAKCGQFIESTTAGDFEQHLVRDHLRNAAGESRRGGWQCLWDGCFRKEVFTHRYQLLRHVRRHTMEAPFTCADCGKTFRRKELLRVHARRAHNDVKNSICETCGKSFASTGDLSRHRRTHIAAKNPKYSCHDCGFTYKDESGLRKHRQRFHAGSFTTDRM